MPKLLSICIYVCMFVTVSYRHLTRGLEIISVAVSADKVKLQIRAVCALI